MRYSKFTQSYVVLVLTLAYTLSFIDRQILAIMIGPIKRDLGGLSDTQVSLILGLAFSLVYALSSLPLARIADRSNRRNLLAAGIFGWSMMTALAGMANTYWQLFVARMGLGVGEAVLQPAATSILADYYDQHRLPLAYGIIGCAPFVGTGLASILGGPLVDYLEAQPQIHLPVVGELFSWQLALMVVGLPGLLLAALMFTIKEPERIGEVAGETNKYSFRDLIIFVRSKGRFLFLYFLAFLCMSIHGYAYLTWVYELFVRKHDWSRTDIGLSFGSISMVTGILGSLLAGYFAGRMLRRGTKDAALRLTLLAVLVMTPTAIVMPLVDNAQLAIYLCIPLSFCMAMPAGLNLAVLQAVAPNRMRGQLVAIYMISVGFLSYLLAPLGIALLNDYVFRSEDAIDLSLALSASLNYPVALACLFLALKPFREAVVKLGDEFR